MQFSVGLAVRFVDRIVRVMTQTHYARATFRVWNKTDELMKAQDIDNNDRRIRVYSDVDLAGNVA